MITKAKLQKISKRSDMFGIRDFEQFLAYINGWDRGVVECHCSDSLFEQLQKVIPRKYGRPPSVLWTTIVVERFGNGTDAIGKFLDLLDELSESIELPKE